MARADHQNNETKPRAYRGIVGDESLINMGRQNDPLVLSEHRIVPAVKHQGAVSLWRCLDCSEEATDAEAYVDITCDIDN